MNLAIKCFLDFMRHKAQQERLGLMACSYAEWLKASRSTGFLPPLSQGA